MKEPARAVAGGAFTDWLARVRAREAQRAAAAARLVQQRWGATQRLRGSPLPLPRRLRQHHFSSELPYGAFFLSS